MIEFLETTKSGSKIVGRAFAQGCGAKIRNVGNGSILEGKSIENDFAVYGWTGVTDLLWSNVRACNLAPTQARNFFYIDNGYLSPGHWDGYFRVTLNALQISPLFTQCNPDFERGASHGIQFKEYRKSGEHILISLQSREWYEFMRIPGGRDQWLGDILTTLAKYTDRPIRIRDKTSTGYAKAERNKTPLMQELEGAHVLISHSSNTAIQAMIAGYPVFTIGHGPGLLFGKANLSEIEDPLFLDDESRTNVIAWLAANQWTLDEMRSGKCWRDLVSCIR